MFYRQSNVGMKWLETLGLMGLLIVADLIWDGALSESLLQPFVIVMVLIAARYGLLFGFTAFVMYFGYTLYSYLAPGGDILLLFYDVNFLLTWLFNLAVVLIAGLYASSQRERYESLHYNLEEVKTDNTYLHDTVNLMEKTQRILKQKLLESDISVQKLYNIAVRLDQKQIELIRSEALAVLSEIYQSSSLAIYHVDSSQKSLRLITRRGSSEAFPQTILINEQESVISRAMQSKKLGIRDVKDADGSPLVVAPILVHEQVKEMIIFQDFDFNKLTPHDLQLLETLMQWIGSRYANANAFFEREEQHKMHEGSRVYKPEFFRKKVMVEQQKEETDSIPHTVLEFDLKKTVGLTPFMLQELIEPHVREIDVMGFSEKTFEFYLLLPGTDPTLGNQIVKERITQLFEKKGVLFHVV